MNLHDMVAQVAFDLYVKSGGVEGRDLDNWLEAEEMVGNGAGYAEEYWDDVLIEHPTYGD